MVNIVPTFWAKYRGDVDPQRPFNIPYQYLWFMYVRGTTMISYNGSFTVLGPPQLNSSNPIELRWTTPPGLVRITISMVVPLNVLYDSNGTEGGWLDRGQRTTQFVGAN